jgi:hypothetical protein
MLNKFTIGIDSAGQVALLISFACAAAFSQTTTDGLAGAEFPVVMRQNVVAGKTAMGTKVQAKLAVATLVKGTVIPEDAILSGEVTESVAMSGNEPSRLAIRIDSAQWKNGSAPLKIYLTAWYYPLATERDGEPDNPMSAVHGSIQVSAGGARPDPRTSASQPFPDPDTDKNNTTLPPRPHSSISKHRVLMKDIESSRNEDGTVTLTSKRFNIKLDKSTTYVLAAGDLGAGSRQQ